MAEVRKDDLIEGHVGAGEQVVDSAASAILLDVLAIGLKVLAVAVEQRSAEFSYSKVAGQRTIFTIRASRQTKFKESDRYSLETAAV